MRRREFINLFGSTVLAWPAVALAQPERMRRIGVLMGYAEDDPLMKARFAAFRKGLEELGWSEGRNVHIDIRFAPASSEQLAEVFAKELVALSPDVLLAHSTMIGRALQRETRVIPIVFVAVGNPIAAGFVTNLARPSGNLTGPLTIEPSLIGKWLEMLKEVEPRLARVALLDNPKTTPYDYILRTATALAPSLGIELVHRSITDAADIERVIESFAQEPNGGLVLPPDVTTTVHRDVIISLAARYRLPAVYFAGYFVKAGGLMSYGIDYNAHFRQGAYYVDRILRGATPADLPVQAPTKFEMMINLKTAKALGLAIPQPLLATADEVIE